VITWLRYVTHEDRAAYEARGWVFAADLGFPHARHALLMQWTGKGEPT
jgi:hypothetical protein